MKINSLIVVQMACLSLAFSANAQGTFQNLNFEQANPVSAGNPYPPEYVTVASALPDWSVYYGNAQQTVMTYNSPGLGSTLATLLGPSSPVPVIDGNYSVLLQGGETASAASITQTATIPSGMQSLFFEAQPGGGSLDVVIGTQTVPFTAVGSGPNYTLYGANISAWAGNTEQLTFSALEDNSGPNNWELDDISFSPTATPEPNTLVLIVMGGAAFAVRQWRKRG
jgi:hypothetical protein